MIYRLLFLVIIFFTTESNPRSPEPIKRPWTLVRTIMHPKPSFTQGLVWHDGSLFESIGLYGSSEVRELDAQTGALRQRQVNYKHEFGEGLALKDDYLIQLTYKEGYALRYMRKNLSSMAPYFSYKNEGWGLCYMPDRKKFARSDGSAWIRFHDQDNFAENGGIKIHRAGAELININELEYARGNLYANIWGTSAQAQRIIEINPSTGQVTAEIDLSDLCKREHMTINRELNGIAYNSLEGVFYVTGKNWENIYVVRW